MAGEFELVIHLARLKTYFLQSGYLKERLRLKVEQKAADVAVKTLKCTYATNGGSGGSGDGMNRPRALGRKPTKAEPIAILSVDGDSRLMEGRPPLQVASQSCYD